jgi:hypothetical protein
VSPPTRHNGAANALEASAPAPLVARDGALQLAVFGGLVLSGVVLRIGLLSSENLLGLTIHNLVFSLHGALTLAVLPLALLVLTPSQPSQTDLRRTLAASYALGAGLVGEATHEVPQARGLYVTGALVMLGALALYVARILAPALPSARGGILALASASLAVSWLGPMLGAPELADVMMFPLVLSALLSPLLALRDRGAPVAGPALWVAAGCYLISRTVVRYWSPGSPLALVEWIAALVVVGAALRAAVHEATAWRGWLLRTQALLFVGGASVTVLAQIASDSSIVDKTLIVAAAMHLEAFVLLFALLGAWMRNPLGTRPLWGLALAALGAHVFGYGCMLLGSQGMPLRYGGYIERFSSMQRVTSLGALILLAGLALIASARRSRR